MPSPSKNKGSSFEREVANFLSNLYGESFIRAPGSGAYVGGKNQSRKQFLHEGQIRSFKGDIVPGQSFTKFNAECKSYKDFPFHLIYTGECKVLDGWIEQMMDVAEDDDVNLLFMKFNRKGRYIAVQQNHHWDLVNYNTYQNNTHGTWVISELEHFFKLNSGLFKTLSQVKN